MYRNIDERTKKWIDKLLSVEFRGKNILLDQLLKSKMMYKQEYEYISIKFIVEGKIQYYPYQVRVPIEMYAYQSFSCPIIFLLHIVNGVVDELEIVTADLSQINPNDIELGNVVYKIKEELIL